MAKAKTWREGVYRFPRRHDNIGSSTAYPGVRVMAAREVPIPLRDLVPKAVAVRLAEAETAGRRGDAYRAVREARWGEQALRALESGDPAPTDTPVRRAWWQDARDGDLRARAGVADRRAQDLLAARARAYGLSRGLEDAAAATAAEILRAQVEAAEAAGRTGGVRGSASRRAQQVRQVCLPLTAGPQEVTPPPEPPAPPPADVPPSAPAPRRPAADHPWRRRAAAPPRDAGGPSDADLRALERLAA